MIFNKFMETVPTVRNIPKVIETKFLVKNLPLRLKP